MPEPMKSSSDAEKSSNSGSESDAESFELPDALATGREKRQTAGNRLRDMLNAELEAEEIFAEDEEDADFGSDQGVSTLIVTLISRQARGSGLGIWKLFIRRSCQCRARRPRREGATEAGKGGRSGEEA